MSDPVSDAPSAVPAAAPSEAGDVASAGRSCLAIVLIGVVLLLLLCVGIAVRWAMA